MAVETEQGDILAADVDALVDPVNVVGVMGKGLALQFKKAFPENFKAYTEACQSGEIKPGKVHIFKRLVSPRFIINFPTKKHWRQPSKLEYIRDGLNDLVKQAKALGLRSIAIPPLGCGNGGLLWSDVKPLILEASESLPGVRMVVYEPNVNPPAAASRSSRPCP